jgi:TPR repeat protein
MCANREGVPKDFVLSYMWFDLAAAQGDSDAQKKREIIAAKMTPSQIAKAQRLVTEWKPKEHN